MSFPRLTVDLDVPEGFALTGEYRRAKLDEYYLFGPGSFAQCRGEFTHGHYPILQKLALEKRSGWINVYESGCGPARLYDTPERAERGAHSGRIACVQVTYEVPVRDSN